MAFSFNGGNGTRGGARAARSARISEINVTPFVDVVLVLLIIFMLTAHVMEFGIEVDVPKVRNVKDSAQELPVVNVTKDARLFLNDKPVNINELVPAESSSALARAGRSTCARIKRPPGTTWRR